MCCCLKNILLSVGRRDTMKFVFFLKCFLLTKHTTWPINITRFFWTRLCFSAFVTFGYRYVFLNNFACSEGLQILITGIRSDTFFVILNMTWCYIFQWPKLLYQSSVQFILSLCNGVRKRRNTLFCRGCKIFRCYFLTNNAPGPYITISTSLRWRWQTFHWAWWFHHKQWTRVRSVIEPSITLIAFQR